MTKKRSAAVEDGRELTSKKRKPRKPLARFKAWAEVGMNPVWGASNRAFLWPTRRAAKVFADTPIRVLVTVEEI